MSKSESRCKAHVTRADVNQLVTHADRMSELMERVTGVGSFYIVPVSSQSRLTEIAKACERPMIPITGGFAVSYRGVTFECSRLGGRVA